ncbi:hypothetical protein LZ30DRAFT_687830 [Colletotrichum cereale]|nr:hypothetical protein LZ30DRAFT_687830 [Colletotrichum cereale]
MTNRRPVGTCVGTTSPVQSGPSGTQSPCAHIKEPQKEPPRSPARRKRNAHSWRGHPVMLAFLFTQHTLIPDHPTLPSIRPCTTPSQPFDSGPFHRVHSGTNCRFLGLNDQPIDRTKGRKYAYRTKGSTQASHRLVNASLGGLDRRSSHRRGTGGEDGNDEAAVRDELYSLSASASNTSTCVQLSSLVHGPKTSKGAHKVNLATSDLLSTGR